MDEKEEAFANQVMETLEATFDIMNKRIKLLEETLLQLIDKVAILVDDYNNHIHNQDNP